MIYPFHRFHLIHLIHLFHLIRLFHLIHLFHLFYLIHLNHLIHLFHLIHLIHLFAGILVIGGFDTPLSVEFWSAGRTCVLSDYPREMKWGPTVNLVSGGLVACYYPNCEIYQNGSWQRLQNTINRRERHSSVAVEDAVLLIGGEYSRTTEWIPVDGSPAGDGPFTVRHGNNHCTLKISTDVIVLTGGQYTEDLVTQYQLSDGKANFLTSMVQQRFAHACGVYLDADDQQVGKVFCSIFLL